MSPANEPRLPPRTGDLGQVKQFFLLLACISATLIGLGWLSQANLVSSLGVGDLHISGTRIGAAAVGTSWAVLPSILACVAGFFTKRGDEEWHPWLALATHILLTWAVLARCAVNRASDEQFAVQVGIFFAASLVISGGGVLTMSRFSRISLPLTLSVVGVAVGLVASQTVISRFVPQLGGLGTSTVAFKDFPREERRGTLLASDDQAIVLEKAIDLGGRMKYSVERIELAPGSRIEMDVPTP